MFKKLALISALVAGSVLTSQAMAAEVSISKLRVNLENGQTADFLTIHNESATDKEAFEISLKKWTEKDNLDTYDGKHADHTPEEVLADTDNVLASPKTVVILPKQEKIVRIIVNNADAAQKDYSYRMIINQLPNREANVQNNTVNLLFKISLPIFVDKDNIKTVEKMALTHDFSADGSKHYITVKNNDTQHIQLQEITVGDKKVPLNHYILPGVTDKIELPDNFNQADLTKAPLVIGTDKGTWSISK